MAVTDIGITRLAGRYIHVVANHQRSIWRVHSYLAALCSNYNSRDHINSFGCLAILSKTTGQVMGSDGALGRDRLAGLEGFDVYIEMGLWSADCAGASGCALCGSFVVYQHSVGTGCPGKALDHERLDEVNGYTSRPAHVGAA